MPIVPPDAGPQLMQAAEEHSRALVPARPDQITSALMEMRLSTQRRNETIMEAEHSFRVLARELADVPLDILTEAIRGYICNEPFFPRSPAELLPFVRPLLNLRYRRVQNLRKLAAEAERERQRQEDLSRASPATLDELRELASNPAVSRSIFAMYVAKGWASQAHVDQIMAEITEGTGVPED